MNDMPSAEPIPDSQIPSNPPNLSDKLPRLTPRRGPRSAQQQPSNPPPPTPPFPAPAPKESLTFSKPTQRILSKRDHDLYLSSPTHDLITSFVFKLSESVRDTSITAVKEKPHDPVIDTLLQILDAAEEIIAKCPPEDNEGSRFGNKAFRDYLDAVEGQLVPWHEKLGLADERAIEEVSTYLEHSFGNKTRIDYGSGHELNFIIWLLCLNRVSLLPESTFQHVTLLVFPRYLRLMRNVQTTYYLEPAGSHGVWGLDDYQFLPFLFGASQLLDHPHLRPMSIHRSMILEECSKDYLYLDQVQFVNSVKNVEGLRWHSPMLDDISSAKSWAKVEAGMRRMFLAEVLGKLPVMQHFLFGSLVPAVEGMSTEDQAGVANEMEETEGGEGVVMADGMKHVHAETGWGDCCGIPVPSSVGAMGEMKKRMGNEGLRRIPFD
ncbi:Serine/threonine-protein phosphatase 2A activator 2 [Zalaria obscura]|uniref:Serine/threonine-protein phosphatase 2A activator 2 n=1 Tax=Zalaria obscura TaxID=2024903 RepID=A0ACC3SIE0_9PEZI